MVAGLLFEERRHELCEGAKTVCRIFVAATVVKKERSFLNLTFKCAF